MGHVPHHFRQGTEEEGGEELGQVQGGRQQGHHGGGGVLPRPVGGLGATLQTWSQRAETYPGPWAAFLQKR